MRIGKGPMKLYQSNYFQLFCLSVELALSINIGFFIYKLDKMKTATSISKTYAAMHITTNLVHRPCSCGFCRPSEGIAVPEHINALGFDTFVEVSTNFLQIVKTPMPGRDSNCGSTGSNALEYMP